MQLYPVVDMKDEQCVRLRQEALKNITIYSNASEKVAAHWRERGTSFLHLVDLDGALTGYSVNEEIIRRIANAVSIPIEIGGGTHSGRTVERMLGLGIRRVIIGTKAVRYPELPRDMVRTLGEEVIVVGVDTKNGVVAVEGWEKVSSLTARDLCLTTKEYGVRYIAYADISRDGMLSGSNVEAIRKFTEETGLDITASDRVSCMEDLKCLHETGIEGTIIGKALCENRIDLVETMKLYEA